MTIQARHVIKAYTRGYGVGWNRCAAAREPSRVRKAAYLAQADSYEYAYRNPKLRLAYELGIFHGAGERWNPKSALIYLEPPGK